MITHIIWDWNGTLLDDCGYALRVANEGLKKHGLPVLEDEEAYRRVFCFPVARYYEAIGLGGALYEEAAVDWSVSYEKNEAECSLREGIPEALEAFKRAGYTQAVVSASPEQLLRRQVTERGIAKYFEVISGLDNIHARSKVHLAQAYIAAQHVAPENVLFIGDTLHDAEVAHAAGCHVVLLAGGHQSAAMLKDSGYTVLNDAKSLAQYARTL